MHLLAGDNWPVGIKAIIGVVGTKLGPGGDELCLLSMIMYDVWKCRDQTRPRWGCALPDESSQAKSCQVNKPNQAKSSEVKPNHAKSRGKELMFDLA